MSKPRESTDPPGPRDRLARVLKWIGAVTSILSLIVGRFRPGLGHAPRGGETGRRRWKARDDRRAPRRCQTARAASAGGPCHGLVAGRATGAG